MGCEREWLVMKFVSNLLLGLVELDKSTLRSPQTITYLSETIISSMVEQMSRTDGGIRRKVEAPNR